jgi:hypothetical protein
MSKNLITKPEVRKALIASGAVTPATATETAARCIKSLQESQAAAIAARRKELGIKPVIKQRMEVPTSEQLDVLKIAEKIVFGEADALINQSIADASINHELNR